MLNDWQPCKLIVKLSNKVLMQILKNKTKCLDNNLQLRIENKLHYTYLNFGQTNHVHQDTCT